MKFSLLPANRRSFLQWISAVLGISGADVTSAATAPTQQQSPTSGSGRIDSEPRARLGGYIRPRTIEIVHQRFELIVVGGGISGTCAAVSAARNGLKTALVHERSMLGGNSSSEVRLFPENTAAQSTWCKESGILDEIHVEERIRNHDPQIEGLMNCHWDLVLYEWAAREPNLTLFLNTSMREVEMRDAAHILAIHAVQLGTEKSLVLEAPLFVDSTGDGVLAYRAGADFRWGVETKREYGEPLAPNEPGKGLMGNTLFFRARDTGRPVPFRRPSWAAEFDAEADLTERGHRFIDGGYWWIEVGAPLHPIRDNEKIRDEALRQVLGVWDHIKNRCVDRARATNYALDFVGFWPYKRESRRVIGDYVLQQKDVQNPPTRADDIAYGCWGIDIHVPGGIHERQAAPYPPPRRDANWQSYGTLPYGIPLRSCYSRNVRNLLTAGRPISTSYVAFASSRVLPTGAVVGQAVGGAAALCRRFHCDPRELAQKHATDLQQLLIRQDCHIPGIQNEDPSDLARQAETTASSEAIMRFAEDGRPRELRYPSAQLFPVSAGRIDSIELLLSSSLPHDVWLDLGLRPAAHVWDFRATRDLARARAKLPGGHHGFVRFDFHADVPANALYYVHLPAQPGVSWSMISDIEGQPSRIPAGTSAADLPGADYWRPVSGGLCFVIRLSPEQRPYGPHNVITGGSRPDRWTNLFESDPDSGLPAWVELRWPKPVRFNQVEITFDTDVNRRITLPLFRYPECVSDYELAIDMKSGWNTVATETGNYFRRRVHRIEPVSSDGLRLGVTATNGARTARVYAIRVYNEVGV